MFLDDTCQFMNSLQLALFIQIKYEINYVNISFLLSLKN